MQVRRVVEAHSLVCYDIEGNKHWTKNSLHRAVTFTCDIGYYGPHLMLQPSQYTCAQCAPFVVLSKFNIVLSFIHCSRQTSALMTLHNVFFLTARHKECQQVSYCTSASNWLGTMLSEYKIKLWKSHFSALQIYTFGSWNILRTQFK